jgi:D-tyrosyl-tRNA(Tyr) deacylase
MRACLQRVARAEVVVAGESIARIGRGLVVLLGVAGDDTADDAAALAAKIVVLRVFDDDAGRMNLALADVAGELLAVSQFTLLGDCRRGRRPSFTAAAPPEQAELLYEAFVAECRRHGARVATGRFRAHMTVSLDNDGPVTLLLDSREPGPKAEGPSPKF